MALEASRTILLAVLVLLATAVLANAFASAAQQSTAPREYNVLIVASDFDDILWARSVALNLRNMEVQVNLSVLYLDQDYPSASAERAKLKDLSFLWRYDAVLIPDLNKLYIHGGRLRQEEVVALLRYTKGGHVLFMGMNTIVQNWHPLLEEAAGAKVIGIASSMADTDFYDIIYNGETYNYNDTFGAIYLEPHGCQIMATFKRILKPAIIVNSYGSGVVVVAAFNPVKAVLDQSNGEEIAKLLASIIADSLARAKPAPLPTSYRAREILASAASTPLRVLEELAARAGGGLLGAAIVAIITISTAYLVLLAASVLCILPRWARLILVRPIANYISFNSLDSHIIDTIRKRGPLTLHEISSRTNIHPRKLCWRLTLLEARKYIVSIPVSKGIAYAYAEDLPTALLAINPLYNKIVSLVTKEPGITIHELAVRLSLPPDTVLKACKELAAHGIIELRKVLIEYEVYPTQPLYQYIKNVSTQTTRRHK